MHSNQETITKPPEQEDKLGKQKMKVFHGTNNKFSEFSSSFFGQNTDDNASDETMAMTAHLGFWFTDNYAKAAEVYDSVMECEVEINNPLEVDTLETLGFWLEQQEMSAEEIRSMLIEQGYDGIVLLEDEEFKGTSYVAFSNDQITIK